jgi:hypothetical protein
MVFGDSCDDGAATQIRFASSELIQIDDHLLSSIIHSFRSHHYDLTYYDADDAFEIKIMMEFQIHNGIFFATIIY